MEKERDMRILMCAVYDAATGAYTQPFFVRSKAEAIRSFADAVGDEKSPFCAHPSDYSLFCLGEYDDQTGAVTPKNVTEKWITATECVLARKE